MNILANYKWIKEYLQTNASVEDFARSMSAKSMSVETIDHLRDRFENMVIGVIKELKPHPDADKLRIVVTDIGTEIVEIVCGGKNLEKDMRVLVALPGARVRWHGEGDFVTLEKVKIRGVESYGMICAPSEVGFEKAPCPEGGIWDVSLFTEAKPGTSFVDAFDLDDDVFDIEVTSNRVDSMSIIGLAREAAAALEGTFSFTEPVLPSSGDGKEFAVTIEDEDLCPRYMAVVIDGVKVGPSPAWLQKKLLLAGHRPINNIVDITNYILHEYGQPLHAFDYDKLKGKEIIVRRAKKEELFVALDGNEYKLTNNNLVIADKERPVALAGVMGGYDSGTREETQTIVFESASFDPVSIRRTSRAVNLYSDSQLLFEKGISTESTKAALAHAIALTLEIAGGRVASPIFDERLSEYKPLLLRMRPQRVRDVIGVDINDEDIERILTTLGFKLEKDGDAYKVVVPFWRDQDIENEVDFAEEIARMYGYEELPSKMPEHAPPMAVENSLVVWERWLKHTLSASGYTEFFGYSFVSERDLTRYDLDPEKALKILNPLSSDLTHMRTSLMPSLLKDIDMNQGTTSQGNVFELSNVYIPKKDDLPEERLHLSIASFGVVDVEKAILEVKGMLEFIAYKTGFDFSIVRTEENVKWHPTRSAKILVNGEEIGMLGQVAETYTEAFGINRPVVAAYIDAQKMIEHMHATRRYEPIPEYPAIVRDIAIGISEQTAFFELAQTIKEQSSIVEAVSFVEVYRGAGVPAGKKSLTLSITLRAPDKTLSSEYADDVMNAIKKVLKEKFDAILR